MSDAFWVRGWSTLLLLSNFPAKLVASDIELAFPPTDNPEGYSIKVNAYLFNSILFQNS